MSGYSSIKPQELRKPQDLELEKLKGI